PPPAPMPPTKPVALPPPPERRPQTGAGAPGSVTAAGEVAARLESERQRERDELEAVGAGAGEHPSSLRLVLLVMGFLAASVLVVFAKPGGSAGAETLATALDLHRRLRGRDVRVVLVLPRGPEATSEAAVHDAGVTGDVPVLLDREGTLRQRVWRAPEEATA